MPTLLLSLLMLSRKRGSRGRWAPRGRRPPLCVPGSSRAPTCFDALPCICLPTVHCHPTAMCRAMTGSLPQSLLPMRTGALPLLSKHLAPWAVVVHRCGYTQRCGYTVHLCCYVVKTSVDVLNCIVHMCAQGADGTQHPPSNPPNGLVIPVPSIIPGHCTATPPPSPNPSSCCCASCTAVIKLCSCLSVRASM